MDFKERTSSLVIIFFCIDLHIDLTSGYTVKANKNAALPNA